MSQHRGFASTDLVLEWEQIHIPVVVVHKSDGERLKAALELEEIEIPGQGTHYAVKEWDNL